MVSFDFGWMEIYLEVRAILRIAPHSPYPFTHHLSHPSTTFTTALSISYCPRFGFLVLPFIEFAGDDTGIWTETNALDLWLVGVAPL